MGVLISVATGAARAIYAVFKGVLPQRHKVVFLSRQSDEPSRDFVALEQALRTADPTLEIVMRCRMVGHSWGSRVVAAFATVGQMYHLATARACVVDGYVIPVSILDHRAGTFVVQIWHALGAIKKFGYQTIGAPGGHSREIASAMRMHRNYDVVVCAGPGTVPFFAEAFGVDPAIVAPVGTPRVDALREGARARLAGEETERSAELKRDVPVLAQSGRTVVLYAPTFRSHGGDRYRDVAACFSDPRYTLIIKPHPLDNVGVGGENLVDAGGIDAVDLIPLCDAVITDYSAVAFEAVVAHVPVYFFVYDIDEYRRDQGLNIDPLVELPEVSSLDIVALKDLIDGGESGQAVMARLEARYASAPEGCAARIAGMVIEAIRKS